jgi:CRP/FNR family cyclic AMP-dependent transcriptional regulator
MDRSEFLSTFTTSRLFQGLTTEEMELMLSLAEKKSFQPGEFVLKENEVGDNFYYLHAGRLDIQLSQTNHDNKIMINQMKATDIVGEMVLLGINMRSASVVARDQAVLFTWNADKCLELFEKNKNLGYVIMKNLSKILGSRVRDMNMMLRTYTEVLGPDALRYL